MLAWDHGGGFSLDGSVRIEATDREGLERLVRYCARPPFSLERLHLVDGRSDQILYILPKPDPAGRTALRLSALEFLDRLEMSAGQADARTPSVDGEVPRSRVRDPVGSSGRTARSTLRSGPNLPSTPASAEAAKASNLAADDIFAPQGTWVDHEHDPLN